MKKQSSIAIALGLSVALLAIAAIFLPLKQQLAMAVGSNMTTGSNMTGATGNTTGGSHGSSIHTTNPAGFPRPPG